ncbi:hypothetical protein [Halorubrum sp. LN27]|nr:hypothetical protein [Halorubrum sp. LN27]
MNPEQHREFLRGLNDDYLMKHIRAYVKGGMDAEAGRAMAERDRRRD